MSATSKQKVSDIQPKTQTAFIALNLITQACHGIDNTTFVSPPQKPTWFDDLNTKLNAAKANGADWVNNLAPGITGAIPAQVINYGGLYSAMTVSIQAIAHQFPNASGANDPHVKEVLALVADLHTAVTGILANVDSMSLQLKTWGEKMQASHDALTTGAANIQSAETDMSVDITKMNTAISTLNATIHNENIAIAISGFGVGVGLVLLIAGIALAPETGGASLLVAGTGGILIIAGGATWGVMQNKIVEQYKTISKDQKELDADKAQLVALQGLATSTSQAVGYINTCTTALSDFRTSWCAFRDELKAVSGNLSSAQNPQNLNTVAQAAFSQAAANDWASATTFAQTLQNAPVQIACAQIDMNGNITSQAACA